MTIVSGSVSKIAKGSAVVQYLATIAASMNIITNGMHFGWPSPSLPKLLSNSSSIPMTSDEGSWIAVMPLLGALSGALIGGATVDILGRKRTIIMTSAPFFAAWMLVAYAPSVIVLCVARFIAGVSDGWIFTAVPMYVGEIADPKIRGFLGSIIGISFLFGILLINVIGLYLSVYTTALICSVLPLIAMVIFVFMPESPYYLLMKGNSEGAKASLQKLRGCSDVETELQRITLAMEEQMKNKGKFLDLFTSKPNRKAVGIMMILRGAKQLSGTTAVTFYAQSIFIEAGDHISSELATIIYFSVQLCLACFCSSIVDRAGRRPLLITSITGSAIALFIEGSYFYVKSRTSIDTTSFSILPVVALVGFVIIFSLGLNTIPIMMLGELFSANVKASALCLADIYFSLLATAVSKSFQILKDYFGIYMPFFTFSGSCLVGLVLVILFVPETTGKTLEEIQVYLKGEPEEPSPCRYRKNNVEAG